MRCEVCGNDYDKAFQVILPNQPPQFFDSFECAIQGAAPQCDHCGIRIVGHGVETSERIYCCVHCATASGEIGLIDRTHSLNA